jgi:hypothetical protein
LRRCTAAIADVLAAQVAGLPCDCLQVDEANITGNPADADLAARCINTVLAAIQRTHRGAFVLRQLRRAGHPEGRLGRARALS